MAQITRQIIRAAQPGNQNLSVLRLFPIELEPLHHGSIVDGKENRFVIGKILMRMPLPKGNDKRISFLPFKVTFSHRSATLPFENVVERCAGVTMNLGFLAPLQKLNFA
jgi:hypothetical protein